MASLTFTAVAIPSFTGLKAGASTTTVRLAVGSCPKAPKAKTSVVRASLNKDVGIIATAVAAAGCLMLSGDALAFDVLLGARNGSLVFEPKEFSVPAGEEIRFKNNAGFPHNVVFDEDEVPPGVDASAISMPEDELLNGPGETFSVVLNEKGTYGFYCAPHQGAGMVGRVTVY